MSRPVSVRRNDLRDGETSTRTPNWAFKSRILAKAVSEGSGLLPRK